MKRYYFFITLALLISLYIYLVYRTDRTVVNLLLESLAGESDTGIRSGLRKAVPLPSFAVYSLPEGLWVFAATLVSRSLFLPLSRFRLDLAVIPLLYALLLEILQRAGYMPGRFDPADLALSFLFAGAALAIPCPHQPRNLFDRFSFRTWSLLFAYGIVFLSHVQTH